jgi:hypothetical protein
VPEVSRFFGIVIAMYHDEHPPPHFHARYGTAKIAVDIQDGRVRGRFPPRALGLVLEWWSRHRAELERNWELILDGRAPERIAPLE